MTRSLKHQLWGEGPLVHAPPGKGFPSCCPLLPIWENDSLGFQFNIFSLRQFWKILKENYHPCTGTGITSSCSVERTLTELSDVHAYTLQYIILAIAFHFEHQRVPEAIT